MVYVEEENFREAPDWFNQELTDQGGRMDFCTIYDLKKGPGGRSFLKKD